MTLQRLFIANRGEVALRVARAAADLGIEAVAGVAPGDPAPAALRDIARCVPLPATGTGGTAYLDADVLIAAARDARCDSVHPGWGFLSERAHFAQAVAAAGMCFVGPTVQTLDLFGAKQRARAFAAAQGVPVLPGSAGAVSPDEAEAFMAALCGGDGSGSAVMLKAVAGGGGCGMRVVHRPSDLRAAFERCTSEAQAAFGTGELFVEQHLARARHIEVQLIGDGDTVQCLADRDCSLQLRFQKLVEWAPAPRLPAGVRERLHEAALKLARATCLQSLATAEFLVEDSGAFFFIEANPRLQVEHTVTEAVTGLDLVQLQLRLAAGAKLHELGLAAPPPTRGVAVQWRINATAAGTASAVAWPTGPGVRIDTALEAGEAVGAAFDALLAKLVVHGATLEQALQRSQRALGAVRTDGLTTNVSLLRWLAARPELAQAAWHTAWVNEVLPAHEAVFEAPGAVDAAGGPDTVALRAPQAGRLVALAVAAGAQVEAGVVLLVLEAMKMEHEVAAPASGQLLSWLCTEGDKVEAGQLLATLEPQPVRPSGAGVAGAAPPHAASTASDAAPAAPRVDLQALQQRLSRVEDAARPDAIARRHAAGLRSARENVADLCDAGSFIEYGALAVAAQAQRRSAEDLAANTPADGIVTGIGSVNAAHFGPERARTAVMAYDATVLAGTQGMRSHQKTDRLLGVALAQRLPVVLYAEGGGGRPGDTDMPIVAGLHVGTFASFARLSGQVPSIGIAAGRCFAGNAALLGCCDFIVATRGSNIGMGGPAMVEGGGLGMFRAEDIGPADVQGPNGTIDVLVQDEAEATAVAKRLLAFAQGPLQEWAEPDATALHSVVPTNRVRVYAVRRVFDALFDTGSVLELRAAFGRTAITALARIEGRAVGVMANDPAHGGGAVDADAADKLARFMQLCNARGWPIVSLIDTPGFMVGPNEERRAQVRHASRLFVGAAALQVPVFAVVLRKAYGLGAMAMAAGGFHATGATIAWPSAEFGAMGLEGAVRLGWRKELAAAAPGAEREALFARLLAQQVEAGSAIHMATTLEIDAVIDPADTRAWLVRALSGARVSLRPRSDTPRFIDTW